VVDRVGFTQKFWVIPGETIHSVKRMLPSPDWKWGLGLGMSQCAAQLPIFPDDMVKKGIEYSDPKATIEELLEVMGCMEAAAGMRAILVLKSQTTETQSAISYIVSNFDELRNKFAKYVFGTNQKVHLISQEWKSLVPTTNQITFLVKTEIEHQGPENGEKESIADVTNIVKPKDIGIGLIKRKPEIRDLTNLVKKKRLE
jgi:hypothetical protein